MPKAAVQIYLRLIAFVFLVIGAIQLISVMVAMARMNNMMPEGFNISVNSSVGGMAYLPALLFGGAGLGIWLVSEPLANIIHVRDEEA